MPATPWPLALSDPSSRQGQCNTANDGSQPLPTTGPPSRSGSPMFPSDSLVFPSFRRTFPISTVIPHIYRHSPYLPSFPISTVIPAQAGIQRRPRTPPFPVAMARPPNHPKNPQFSMTRPPLRSAHKCGTLAISKSGNPAPKGRRPPKSQPGRPSTQRPVGLQIQPGKKHREKNRATIKKPGSGQHGQNRRYCNHRRIRHALRSIPRGCVRPRRGRSHRSMPAYLVGRGMEN